MSARYQHVGGPALVADEEVGGTLEMRGTPIGVASAVDLEIVDHHHVSPHHHDAPAGNRSILSLSALAPPLLSSDSESMHDSMSVPIWKRPWIRCGCEIVILLIAMVIAYYVGSNSHSTDGDPTVSIRAPPVIMVSFDGFRYDYLDLVGAAKTPNFHAFRTQRNSVVANRLVPSFPTLTFPNHYTLVTGQVPESHGITANRIFDSATGLYYSYTNLSSQTSEWWRAQTIWGVANQFNTTTGAVFWAGSETVIQGQQPTKWLHYEESMSNTARIDQLFAWIDSGDCTLCLIYFSDVDSAGHAYGAASTEALAAVVQMDALVGDIQSRLVTRSLDKTASLVLLADHGMATVKDKIYLDDYLDLVNRGLTHQELGSFVNIWLPLPIDTLLQDEVTKNLTGIAHLTCWKKDDTPDYLHYQASSRIAPVNCVCDVGWVTSARTATSSWVFGGNKGVHGYLPSADEMHAIFMVQSPALDSGVDGKAGTIDRLANVNVFNLVSHLLHISPTPNNGTLVDFAPFLSTKRTW